MSVITGDDEDEVAQPAFGTRAGGSGFSLRASLRQWAKGWLSGGPHFTIGPRYLLRWYVIPRNPWLNVYLHQFLHDDEDRALHDHPWWFVSVMLKGAYVEVVQNTAINRYAPSIAFRRSTHAHRVVLPRDEFGPVPCWTLVITGRVTRDWGFHCPQGWRHWKEFTAADDYGQVGKGCD
jgi:hypothetical protein